MTDEEEEDSDAYEQCCCDVTRRKETSLDGWSLYCDKCLICGRYGHFRKMPGAPTKFKAGFCEYHYMQIEQTSNKDILNAFSRAKGLPIQAALVICGEDMAYSYYQKQRDAFLLKNHSEDFFDDLFDYIDNPVRPNLGHLMSHLPEELPYDENMKLKTSLVARFKPFVK